MFKCFLLKLIRIYKITIAPLLPPACRYTPTCSVYMYEAIERYGEIKGVWLGLKRLFRCHPFCVHYSKVDPVP